MSFHFDFFQFKRIPTESYLCCSHSFAPTNRKPASPSARKTAPLISNISRPISTRSSIPGPTLTDDGETPLGSLVIIEVADRAEAEAFAVGDPYAKAGVFEDVTIKATRQVYPKPDDSSRFKS